MTEADTDSIDAQAPPLQLCGVKDYLDANVASINQNGKGKGSQSQSTKRAQQSSSIGEPVSLGSKTSHYVSALNTLCQAKGFVPVFVIDDDASLANFGGVLKLGDVTVTSEQRWHSKKEAREGLAKKGLDAVRDMAPGQKMSTQGEGDEKNWIGLLLEYHNLKDPTQGPRYELFSLGLESPPYGCTCSTPHVPNQIFGSSHPTHQSRKAARANAAREAVEYLISSGEMNQDGSNKAKQKTKLGAAVRLEGKGLEVKNGTTCAQKVQDLCPILGFTSPQYTLLPADQAPNMLSGYGSFPTQPGAPRRIGEVRNVFGKKNAKEEIAKGVWEFLKGEVEKRGVSMLGVEE